MTPELRNWTNNLRILAAMIKPLAPPCLQLAGLFAAVAETVKLDLQGWTVLADARLVNGESKAN